RLLSIAQMLVFTAMLIAVMLLLVVGPVVWNEVSVLFHLPQEEFRLAWGYVRYGVSGALLFLMIAVSYYTLPNIRQRWLAVVPGSLAVVIGWVGAAEIFAIYLAK